MQRGAQVRLPDWVVLTALATMIALAFVLGIFAGYDIGKAVGCG